MHCEDSQMSFHEIYEAFQNDFNHVTPQKKHDKHQFMNQRLQHTTQTIRSCSTAYDDSKTSSSYKFAHEDEENMGNSASNPTTSTPLDCTSSTSYKPPNEAFSSSSSSRRRKNLQSRQRREKRSSCYSTTGGEELDIKQSPYDIEFDVLGNSLYQSLQDCFSKNPLSSKPIITSAGCQKFKFETSLDNIYITEDNFEKMEDEESNICVQENMDDEDSNDSEDFIDIDNDKENKDPLIMEIPSSIPINSFTNNRRPRFRAPLNATFEDPIEDNDSQHNQRPPYQYRHHLPSCFSEKESLTIEEDQLQYPQKLDNLVVRFDDNLETIIPFIPTQQDQETATSSEQHPISSSFTVGMSAPYQSIQGYHSSQKPKQSKSQQLNQRTPLRDITSTCLSSAKKSINKTLEFGSPIMNSWEFQQNSKSKVNSSIKKPCTPAILYR